jgi:hypothetical protein
LSEGVTGGAWARLTMIYAGVMLRRFLSSGF